MADGFDDIQVDQNAFSSIEAAQPKILGAAIAEIIAKLPEGEQATANEQLMNGVQGFLSNCKEALIAASTRETARLREVLVHHARAQTEAKLAELVKQAGPMTADEMQKLVSQEYLRFDIRVEYFDANDNVDYTEKIFVIREVPQAIEKKITDAILHQIVPAITKVQGIKFTTGESNVEKLNQAVKVVPEVFDIVSEICALCLNPYGKETFVTKEWVQNNMSSARMLYVLNAQFMANRLRDFISGAYRVSLGI